MLADIQFRNNFQYSLEITVKIIGTGAFPQFNKSVQDFFLRRLITVY